MIALAPSMEHPGQVDFEEWLAQQPEDRSFNFMSNHDRLDFEPWLFTVSQTATGLNNRFTIAEFKKEWAS